MNHQTEEILENILFTENEGRKKKQRAADQVKNNIKNK